MIHPSTSEGIEYRVIKEDRRHGHESIQTNAAGR